MALIGAWNAVLRWTLGFARRRLFSTQRTNQVCVRCGRSSTYLSVPSSRSTLLVPNIPWKEKKVLDGSCIVSLASFTPQYDSEQDLGSPEALIHRGEEPSEDDKPFLPRFLLQEIIFAHSPSFQISRAFR